VILVDANLLIYAVDRDSPHHVRLIGPGEKHWPILRNLLNASGTAGNLTSDAHLAALAIEHGATIASTDHDFRRYAGVTLVNPLLPA
jgi:predicted nucleic acid-binding protein